MKFTHHKHNESFNFKSWFYELPKWLVVSSTIIIVGFASFWADDNANLSKFPPSLLEIQTKLFLLGKVIVGSAETIAIVSAVVLYYQEAKDRQEQKHYEAWQVLDNAVGKETSYARYKALVDLNSDRVSLDGLDAPKADLREINLSKADLKSADLTRANLEGANLEGADLKGAKLEGADLSDAVLTGAKLIGANLNFAHLNRADLTRADLIGAKLIRAKLIGAKLTGAKLRGADLTMADLRGAKLEWAKLNMALLSEADLRGADLRGADLEGAYLNGAKLIGAKLEWAYLRKADLRQADLSKANLSDSILLATDLRETKNIQQSQFEGENPPLICNSPVPQNIKIDPDRDCDKIAADLHKRFPEEYPSLDEAQKYVEKKRKIQWD